MDGCGRAVRSSNTREPDRRDDEDQLSSYERMGLADEIRTVSTQEAMATARRLARHEGIFVGTSTGANVAAALRVAARLGPGRTVVTVAVDSGMKYLSTALYADP